MTNAAYAAALREIIESAAILTTWARDKLDRAEERTAKDERAAGYIRDDLNITAKIAVNSA